MCVYTVCSQTDVNDNYKIITKIIVIMDYSSSCKCTVRNSGIQS